MDYWCIEIKPRSEACDAAGRTALIDIRFSGHPAIRSVRTATVYLLQGTLDRASVERIARRLLVDPVTQDYTCTPGLAPADVANEASVEVHYQPGVMDPTALSTLRAIRELMASPSAAHGAVEDVRTARRYFIEGAASAAQLEQIARQVLANDCIESAYVQGFGRKDELPDRFPVAPRTEFNLRHVPLRDLDSPALARLSRQAHLFLSLEELTAVRDHFRTLDRDPTDLELETIAQTWSEHCVHKTLKSEVHYQGDGFERDEPVELQFGNLLKDTIVRATEHLKRDWCLSVFVDNAGVIAFDDEYGVAVKVETHNHPSAIEPYGGAATGVGGCIRDIMGCGLGAKPIASTDVFCIAPPNFPDAKLPPGVLHPRRVLRGIVSGVRDYGNRMGIPTVNGAVHFDPLYLANPLVFCGNVGLIPRNRLHKAPQKGDFIVVAGGRTGRDGIHGATFSSAELTDTHADEFSHAVQIGNPIEEKKTLDALLLARDHASGCLFNAVTDCGAGGLSSAVGEMAEKLGAEVDLEKVPLKYTGLQYSEIWISEAQERMVFAVDPARVDAFIQLFAAEDVEATVIGRFTGDGRLTVRYAGTTVGRLDMQFLHHGLPKPRRQATWHRPPASPRDVGTFGTTADQLLGKLATFTVCSKEWVIRQYDHEVQGGSVIKPLSGPGRGPSGAAVLRPRLESYRGIALACGLAPHLSEIDPYLMAIAAVDEALRNVICVGADPDRIAILDNFCWPGVDDAQAMGTLVRACRGASDAAIAYGLPFISGKDSLNNQFSLAPEVAERLGLPQKIAIPGTLLISAIGIVNDVRRCVSMDLKSPGNRMVLLRGPNDSRRLDQSAVVHRSVAGLISQGRVRAAHDLSEGGLAVTLAEMCIASGLGLTVDLDRTLAEQLFAEPVAGYVLELTEGSLPEGSVPLGLVQQEPRLIVRRDGDTMINLAVKQLSDAWNSPLARCFGEGAHG